jgi:hypothetical protein
MIVATALFFAPRGARAFERQWHVGVDGGYAVWLDSAASGFGGGAHAAYGLSDSFNAMLELAVTRHPSASVRAGSDENAPSFSVETIASGAAGIAYTIDIARAVPYVGVLAGMYSLGELSGVSPGGQVALGLDYQLERNWAIGAQLRFHAVYHPDTGALPYTTTFLRAEYLWGF